MEVEGDVEEVVVDGGELRGGEAGVAGLEGFGAEVFYEE